MICNITSPSYRGGAAALLVALVVLSACSKKPATTKGPDAKVKNTATKNTLEPKKGDFVAGTHTEMFTAALAADPETFDTAKMSGAPEGRIAFNIFEGLYMPGPTTEGLKDASELIVPGVAQSHTLSADGKTYTFKLRQNAKWSDGTALTSKDFVYSWKRILTPGFSADYVEFFYIIEGAKEFNKSKGTWDKVGIKAKSDHELVVTLKRPVPYFLELLAFYTFFPTPKQAVEKHGDDWTKPKHIVSNGPYKMVSYKPQQEIMLEKSKTYWDAASVHIDKVKLRIIADNNARVNAYKTGQLHWTGSGLPVAQITTVLMNPDYLEEPLLGTYFFRINVSDKNSPLSDLKVRQALSLSVDREVIVEETLSGLHDIAQAYVPPTMPGYKSKANVGLNLKKAKKLLEEAGFTKDKPLPTLELLYNTDENHKLVAESLQQMWKQNLGLTVKLINKEWKTYLQDIDTLKYQIVRAGWIGDYNDPMTFLEMWTSGNGNNDTGWSDANYDKLISDAMAETDTTKRLALLQDAESLLLEQSVIIPIYHYNTHTLRSRFIKGYGKHNRDVHLLKYMKLEQPSAKK